jgi:hypothetical protein
MGGGLEKEMNGMPKKRMRCPMTERKTAAVRIHRDLL